MADAISNALSGLNAAATRLQVSANNIANLNSTQTVKDSQVTDGFTPQKVDQVSVSGGGVKAKVSNDNSGSGVNLEKEIVNQSIASYDYQANLKTIKVAQNNSQALLDIIS